MNTTPREKMQDLRERSRETISQMAKFSAEMLALNLEHIQAALREHQWNLLPTTRTLVLTLDACDSPITNDRKLLALKTQWPDVVFSEIIFDKNSNKFFIFTQ